MTTLVPLSDIAAKVLRLTAELRHADITLKSTVCDLLLLWTQQQGYQLIDKMLLLGDPNFFAIQNPSQNVFVLQSFFLTHSVCVCGGCLCVCDLFFFSF